MTSLCLHLSGGSYPLVKPPLFFWGLSTGSWHVSLTTFDRALAQRVVLRRRHCAPLDFMFLSTILNYLRSLRVPYWNSAHSYRSRQIHHHASHPRQIAVRFDFPDDTVLRLTLLSQPRRLYIPANKYQPRYGEVTRSSVVERFILQSFRLNFVRVEQQSRTNH